jgi:hypothetical protein
MTVFESLKAKVGKFSLANKKLLVPEMGRTVSHLIGATMRSFGVDAQVMETYKGLKLGKQYTSGKECFPCQVTLGDVLYHLEREKERLGEAFRAENYLYFMAESGGPCRFGMYNKLHRIVMDSMDGFSKTRITRRRCGHTSGEVHTWALSSVTFSIVCFGALAHMNKRQE